MKRPEKLYYYRGDIERGVGYNCWKEGYSANGVNGGILYPWNTKRECQIEAKKNGYKAIFIDGRTINK